MNHSKSIKLYSNIQGCFHTKKKYSQYVLCSYFIFVISFKIWFLSLFSIVSSFSPFFFLNCLSHSFNLNIRKFNIWHQMQSNILLCKKHRDSKNVQKIGWFISRAWSILLHENYKNHDIYWFAQSIKMSSYKT